MEDPNGEGFRNRTVETNGVRLRVIETGPSNGCATLVLHGFPENAHAWVSIARLVARSGKRVILPDQRGYDLSEKPFQIAKYNSEVIAGDVLGLVNESGCAQVDLVAHDWGGHIAWWAAARYPQRIRRLVVLSAAHPRVMFRNALLNPRQMLKSWYVFAFQLPVLPEWFLRHRHFKRLLAAMNWEGPDGPMSPEQIARFIQAWSRPRALASMINWYRAAARTLPLTLDEPRIRVPTLLIWGDRDQFLDRALAGQSIEYCDYGRIVYLPGASHWAHHEEPENVARLILDFMK